MNFAIRFFLSLCSLACPLVTAAQQAAIYYTRDARESIQAAEVFMGRQEWDLALKQLKHTTRLKGKMAVTYRLLGKVQLELGLFAQAAESYGRSFELDAHVSRAAYFECGEAQLANGQIEAAMQSFTTFVEMANKRYANKTKETASEALYDELIDRRLASCKLWLEVDSLAVSHWPEIVEGQINTSDDEYMPSVDQTGNTLIFTRQEKDGNENIYHSRLQDHGKWGWPRPLSEEVHTPLNEGMAKYAPLSKSFLFAGCKRSDSHGSCDIYKSFIDEEGALDIYPVPGHLNSPFWDSQPSVSCDGRSIYFSSMRPGGFGGADIWVSHQQNDGTWGTPHNLGSAINTEGDEEGPYIANDGQTLFFSSDGHPGYGLNDLFTSSLQSGKWETARNLGFPINSAGRELGIHVFANLENIVFASSRNGSMDLWESELPVSLRPNPTCQIAGEVFDMADGQPLSGVIIHVKSDSTGLVLYSDEYGFFSACLPGGKAHSLQIDHPGYTYYVGAEYVPSGESIYLPIPLETSPPQRQATTSMERKVQIFFPLDSTDPDPGSVKRLEELTALLRNHPGWQIEITGYADASGTSAHNHELSRARAEAIAAFLKKAGIQSGSIVGISGLGALDNEEQSRRADIILRAD